MVDEFFLTETWKSDCEEFMIGSLIDDTDSLLFCLEIGDFEVATIVLDRANIESLVDFLAEWTGFPMFVDSNPLGVSDEKQ
jgi:hypothetical protein|tara:strand:+ start:408 stop:650 length:243 start_codon:yes stop_codon:yes gene_type:complete